MDHFDTELVAGEGSYYFSNRLLELSSSVGIPPPVFQGKREYKENGLEKWMIKTTIFGREDDPEDQPMEYTDAYVDWTHSVEVAMQGAIARIRHKYHESILRTSPYYCFGERDEDGLPVDRGETEHLSILHTYMTEREITTVNLENMLRNQIAIMDDAKSAVEHCNLRIIRAETACLVLDDKRNELKERIKLLEEPQKLEEKLICSEAWGNTMQKTVAHMRASLEKEWMEKEQLRKEKEKLLIEIESLKSGMVDLTFELCDQDSQIKEKDAQIATLTKLVPLQPPPLPPQLMEMEEEDPEERVMIASDGEEIPKDEWETRKASRKEKRSNPYPLACLATIKRR